MAKIEVAMPKMGESITEGTVLEWHKQVGESIELDEILLEIGTDKVDTEVPSPTAGVLVEILVPEGETVDVGTAIALVESDVDAASMPTAPPVETPAPVEQSIELPAAPPAPAVPPPGLPPMPPADAAEVEVVMPKMGESIMEGTILEWHKKVGDEVELDETLLEIATDKVDTEVPSPSAGFVKRILVPEGETVEVGTPIALLAVGASGIQAPSTPTSSPEPRQAAKVSAPSQPTEYIQDSAPIPRKGEEGEFYSPLVRSIAEKEGVSLAELRQLNGTGREGRVTKQDLLSYLDARKRPAAITSAPASTAGTPAPAIVGSGDGRVEIMKMDRMRQIIAEHMVRSKATSAHVTSFAEADVTNLVRLREANKAAFFNREGVKLTYTPFFVHAAVEALREHPILNASVEGKEVLIKKDLHIGIAVAIGKSGLLAPVIRHAEQMNVRGLALAAADLATRARNKELLPDQLQGGTFTVTNIGSLGSIMGTPIINQPQVAILATGAIKKRPVVIEDPQHGDMIGIRQMMYVSLSYDHRIIDGAMGSSFLKKYVSVLESADPGQVI